MKREGLPALTWPLRLSAGVAGLALVASAGGLGIEGLYHDNRFVMSAWKGTDAVTLFVATPLLVAAMVMSMHGSRRAQLAWFGMLDYMLYTYAYYLFGAVFNTFFLIYVALFTLSMLALIFALTKIDPQGFGDAFRARTPVKRISGYMMIVAAGLSAVYLAQSIRFIITGQLPEIVVATGHPTNVVFALDLSLLVPGLVLGAYWLWNRRPWGYVLATVINVKSAVYTLALAAGSLWASNAGVPGASAQIPLWLGLTLGGSVASALLLTNMRSERRAPSD